ncbi:hypothetical protein AND_004466 [Anopheles darlingi]|uniref:Uncharacterized protein n=1 Tax=Anopheles darlingi TaxID=43151 RepID=W5JM03_ANODA|nr:hypothetical protein AND_004466 [Anopheles darlingi]
MFVYTSALVDGHLGWRGTGSQLPSQQQQQQRQQQQWPATSATTPLSSSSSGVGLKVVYATVRAVVVFVPVLGRTEERTVRRSGNVSGNVGLNRLVELQQQQQQQQQQQYRPPLEPVRGDSFYSAASALLLLGLSLRQEQRARRSEATYSRERIPLNRIRNRIAIERGARTAAESAIVVAGRSERKKRRRKNGTREQQEDRRRKEVRARSSSSSSDVYLLRSECHSGSVEEGNLVKFCWSRIDLSLQRKESRIKRESKGPRDSGSFEAAIVVVVVAWFLSSLSCVVPRA